MTLPNQLTLLRMALTPVFVVLFFRDESAALLLSFVVFTVASLTDWYDGYAARKFGVISAWGKFLDPLADKILISAGFLCFHLCGYFPLWMLLIMVTRDLIVTVLRCYSQKHTSPLAANFFAKSKTFGQFIVIYFLFIYHLLLQYGMRDRLGGILPFIERIHLISILMILITFLTVASGLVYLIENRSQIRRMGAALFRLFAPSDV